MRRLHFWLGVSGIVAFLLTGQYMDKVYDHLEGLPNDVRMLFRSSHIYLLLVSVANLVLGLHLQRFSDSVKRVLQYIVSAILLVTPFVLLAGFFAEPHMDDLMRPYSRTALYGLFGAGITMIIMEIFGDSD
ncbi:MAG: hypothetical protein AAF438_05765 [Pseudomonadota bacterium]